MKKKLIALVLVGGFAPFVTSNHESQSVLAALNCSAVERVGTVFNSALINQINAYVSGANYSIGQSRKMQIRNITALQFQGCHVNMKANVALQDSMNSPAYGTMQVRAYITNLDLPQRRLCYADAQVTEISVASQSGITESLTPSTDAGIAPGCFQM